ncbi:MAG: DUF177 domain-containing protein [Candidatus Binatia bacterium]
MIIRITDLSCEPKRLCFELTPEDLNEALAANPGCTDQRFAKRLEVEADAYLSGEDDVIFVGGVEGEVEGICPRCLDRFCGSLHREFRFLVLREGTPGREEDDEGLAHHDGLEVDLASLAREQAILELDDTKPCFSGCLGLCPGCGANLNRESCSCEGRKTKG